MTDDNELVPGSLVRRWRLGRQLRELRENAGRTMDEAADYIGLARPTISRIENGRHAILPRNVKFLCQLYEIGPPLVDELMREAAETSERGWWLSYSDAMPDWFETYAGYEADARAICSYESELVPALLQIPEYMRGTGSRTNSGTHSGTNSGTNTSRTVEFRQARQRRLTTSPPRMRVVLNEAVLHRPVGGHAAMAAQLRHLAGIGREPWAEIQVIPFDAGPHGAMAIGPFTMLTRPDEHEPGLVYLEHLHGASYLERPDDIARYNATFDDLSSIALSADASRKLLVTLAEQHSGEREGP